MRKNKLTAKQKTFVQEYLKDLNATQACIRAGYAAKNADCIGPELLGKTWVAAAIQAAMDERAKRNELTADRVLKEIQKIAFFDARKLFDDEGHPIHVSKLDDETAAAIAGMDVVTMGNQDVGFAHVLKVKLSDKRASLELLGRHLKLFTDKIEVSVNDTLAARLAKAKKRSVDQ